MAEIAWTNEAQRWLSDIFEYIAADNRAQELKQFPQLGARYLSSSRLHGALDITRYQL